MGNAENNFTGVGETVNDEDWRLQLEFYKRIVNQKYYLGVNGMEEDEEYLGESTLEKLNKRERTGVNPDARENQA